MCFGEKREDLERSALPLIRHSQFVVRKREVSSNDSGSLVKQPKVRRPKTRHIRPRS